MKVYGPYKYKNGRKFVVLKSDDGKLKSKYYTRYLVEKFIGKELDSSIHVHHLDGNADNNSIDNLQLLDAKTHLKNHQLKYKESEVFCVLCGTSFKMTPAQISTRNREKNRNKTGPFCSKVCSGKYGKQIQMKLKS